LDQLANLVHTKARVHTHGDGRSIASDPANPKFIKRTDGKSCAARRRLSRGITDTPQQWFDEHAADGFNVMPPYFREGFDDSVAIISGCSGPGTACSKHEANFAGSICFAPSSSPSLGTRRNWHRLTESNSRHQVLEARVLPLN
jgi:hypothetical protein